MFRGTSLSASLFSILSLHEETGIASNFILATENMNRDGFMIILQGSEWMET